MSWMGFLQLRPTLRKTVKSKSDRQNTAGRHALYELHDGKQNETCRLMKIKIRRIIRRIQKTGGIRQGRHFRFEKEGQHLSN